MRNAPILHHSKRALERSSVNVLRIRERARAPPQMFVFVYANVCANTIHNEFICAPRGVLLRTRIKCYALFHVVQLQLSIAVDLRCQQHSNDLATWIDQLSPHPRWKRRGKPLIIYLHYPYHKPLVHHQVIGRLKEVALVIKMVSWEVT